MVKAFENLELWWVTGAQLLYGGETVKIVDGHSQEMVDGLNQTGIIPIKVVYKGTVNSSREVECVMKAANNDDTCVGIIMDAHFLTRQDVDQGSARPAEAPAALPHSV